MNALTVDELREFIQGDLTKLEKMSLVSHQDLEKRYKTITPIVITTAYVRRVLEDFRNGKVEDHEVQKWASFIRSGIFCSSTAKPIYPIDLDYEVEKEDLIVEVIGRLDELGDKVDGEISEIEIDNFLKLLSD